MLTNFFIITNMIHHICGERSEIFLFLHTRRRMQKKICRKNSFEVRFTLEMSSSWLARWARQWMHE